MKKVLSLVCLLAIVATCLFAFASCGATPNADPAEAKKALEAAEYKVLDMTTDGVGVLSASKGEEVVTITYCASEEDAEKAYEALEKELEALEEAAAELGEEVNYEIGISGKMVWAGTPDAIAAAE